MFGDSELLQCVADGVLSPNPGVDKEPVEFCSHVLASFVVAKDSDSLASDIFRPRLVTSKRGKDIRLLRNEIDRQETRVVVYERDPIRVAMPTLNWHRAMHVREHPLQGRSGACSRVCVRCAGKLPVDAVF